MPAVPEGYPFSLSDENLDGAIVLMLEDLGGWAEFESLLPEIKLAIIQAGLAEKERRETEELRLLTRAAASAADHAASLGLRVALTALVVAVASVLVQLD